LGACGRGKQQRAIGNRLLDRVEQFGLGEDMIGTGGGALGADVRPAVPRLDDAQPRQCEIAHRTRGHADVLAKLGLDQNDDGTSEVKAGFGLVGPRHLFTF